jgi:hypothetical protein
MMMSSRACGRPARGGGPNAEGAAVHWLPRGGAGVKRRRAVTSQSAGFASSNSNYPSLNSSNSNFSNRTSKPSNTKVVEELTTYNSCKGC